MRTLPYTTCEIDTALARTIELFPISRQNAHVRNAWGGDGLYVEMSSSVDGYGAYSRAAVTGNALTEALNPVFLRAVRDHLETIDPAFRDAAGASLGFASLQLAGRPWERFTFDGLRKLMVEQLIPTQIAWRVPANDYDLRTVIYFSPKEIKVFGLA
jgi:hypothetical protein